MVRRRRPTREVPFSLDSFLDIVANVVGIIVRMILVVWVAARSYSTMQVLQQPKQQNKTDAIAPLKDPLQDEIARHEAELREAQAGLLAQIRQLQEMQTQERQAQRNLNQLLEHEQELVRNEEQWRVRVAEEEEVYHDKQITLEELGKRRRRLLEEIERMKQQPVKKKLLRYRTPVSQPVHTDEFHFECRQGRITFIDFESLMADIQRSLPTKVDLLRRQWRVYGQTVAVGAFRLQYTIGRRRVGLEALLESPDPEASFSYGLEEAVLEPLFDMRGETLEQALSDGSQFRQVVDRLSELAVVTFWVYPDSFPLYRRLRDYLADRGIVVAGRPLPHGFPIAISRYGTRSRGQ
ncbi:MAG: hypothetical protein KatS3mg105_2980 [Gemmatales bacterium]|nr:MAG: hypothetical protein KatS3mg105_2980 [Gemmatales bacterium]